MSHLLLGAWSSFHFSGGSLLLWLFGLIAIGWLGIQWWSAHLEKQFERDQPAKTHVKWRLVDLLKLLVLLFLILVGIFGSML
jgi:hypothetical protein